MAKTKVKPNNRFINNNGFQLSTGNLKCSLAHKNDIFPPFTIFFNQIRYKKNFNIPCDSVLAHVRK